MEWSLFDRIGPENFLHSLEQKTFGIVSADLGALYSSKPYDETLEIHTNEAHKED